MKPRFFKLLFFHTVLFALAGPSWALDWNDSEWKKRGCPDGLAGVWKAETPSPLAGQEMEFREDNTLLIVRSGRDLELSFTGDLKAGNRRFIDLEIKSGAGETYPRFLRIRPHLGPAKNSTASLEDCRIKLFRYENAVRAKQNREHSWDIFHVKE